MSVKKLFDLSGRAAIVTGGSRGLGLQIAEALGEMGAKLALTARKKDELDHAVEHLAKQGIAAQAFACDIGKRDTIPGVFDQILKSFGRVDILVNNAGAVWGAPAEDHPLEAWDKLVSLNLIGSFVMSQQAAKKAMIPAKWGRIINVASVAGPLRERSGGGAHRVLQRHQARRGRHDQAARRRMGRARHHGERHLPGLLPLQDDASHARYDGRDGAQGDADAAASAGPEDLKGLAVLLASEASRHITGQAIAVDGGAMLI